MSEISSGSGLVAPHDHPDFVGGIVWSECELAWINKRISDAEEIIAQKDAEIIEQCRLNGMGAERELALLAKVDRQDAAPTPPAEERWISIKHRLPAKETPVLILLDGNVTIGEIRWEYPGFEDTFKAHWYWDSPEDDGQGWESDQITHWMPLPKAPARQEDKP